MKTEPVHVCHLPRIACKVHRAQEPWNSSNPSRVLNHCSHKPASDYGLNLRSSMEIIFSPSVAVATGHSQVSFRADDQSHNQGIPTIGNPVHLDDIRSQARRHGLFQGLPRNIGFGPSLAPAHTAVTLAVQPKSAEYQQTYSACISRARTFVHPR